ncbi:MAG: WbqC family protein [Tidjanibacter sp.]|nr:WbqC family protein [Tidjanibacter sp.]
MRTILPLTYFGSLEWWGALLGGDAIIDVGENYVKQSARNRAEILSASGVMPLTVNVVKGASIHKKPMREMRIDYSKRWQHLHRTAIRSAYRNSPYYDYFAERFEPLYCRRYDFLYDFDRDSLLAAADIMGVDRGLLRFSEEYLQADAEDVDLRGHDFLGRRSASKPYYQVFSDRMPFVDNLSVADLIFCEGRDALHSLL